MDENQEKGLVKTSLPTLAELHYDVQVAFKNDELNLLLNQPPPKDWIRNHPMAKRKNDEGKEVPALYIPIDKIEYMLTRIFQQWRVEVLHYSALFNSVAVHVRLHYLNPVSGLWSYHDGLGAVAVQVDKGESASNMAAIKHSAVMMALPAAESYAVKDAAEKIGGIFGKDLNRRDIVPFTTSYSNEAQLTDLKELLELKREALSPDELEDANRIIESKEAASYPKLFEKLSKL